MTVGQYTTSSGIAGPTEQDTLNQLDSFITGALGWRRIDVITDTGTDNDRVWYSEGEVPGKYMPIYLRVRAVSDDIRFHVYTFWNPDTHTGNDAIFNSTEIQIPNSNSGGQDEYVFFGNKDVIYVSNRLNSSSSNYLGGAGYWDTFYTSAQDPYPLFVFGQNSNADTFANTARVRSYAYGPEGFLEPISTYSGSNAVYVAQDRTFLTNLAVPNPRDNRRLMLKEDFYTQRSRTDGTIPGQVAHEIRGEIPGLYRFSGTNFIPHERLVASGISIGDGISGGEVGVGDWVVIKSTNSNTHTIGPCVEWEQHPNTIPNIELWLKADAYHRDPTGTIGGFVDLSVQSNSATQSTVSQQPRPTMSGTNYNGQPVAEFDGTDYLTGALSVVDDCTAFVVADYVVGPSQRPLLTVRGLVGSDDTTFALEFNTTVSGSAQVTVRSDGSPMEQDIERYSGLIENTAYILSVVVSGTTTRLYVDGDYAGSATVSDTKAIIAGSTELNYAIGATLDGAGAVNATARHEGNIAEVIMYARDLTNEEHQSVVCYLGDKYGITVSGTCA